MSALVWTVLAAAALYWPGRTLSILDGLPLNGIADAVVLGVVVPLLWVVHRQFLDKRWVRVALIALLGVKLAGSALLAQEGLCARFSTEAPFRTEVLTIPIEEPRGTLRSWDVRADWQSDAPSCTAIFDRPYATLSAFPAWFLNLIDFDKAPRNIRMGVSGVLRVADSGRFAIDLDKGMNVSGEIGSQTVTAANGTPVAVTLEPGTHRIALHATLTGDRWRFAPTWNGRNAWSAAWLTVGDVRAIDRWLAPIVRFSTVALVAILVGFWGSSFLSLYRESPMAVAWCAAASVALAATAAAGSFGRFAGLGLIAAPVVPIAAAHRTWRGAMLLVGVPWFAFFVAQSFAQIGHVSVYSVDDWLAYQAAGYRIFMNGFWLEGGSRVFDYQPLYRWISGALHLVFGDSSVGEVYWDAACLCAGGFVAYRIVSAIAGFEWAIGAAAVTLGTFTLGTIWYFVGRGLSEIAAAGFAFFAALRLLPGGDRERAVAVSAGLMATLMFYARLNHLLFAPALIALVVPADVPAAWRRVAQAIRRIDWRPAAAYLATFAAGVALFALRTWWYTGQFSILYGTSLRHNDTGLRLTTIASPDVWGRIAHSVSALVWMNEPPHADPRALVVVAGMVIAVLALLQIPFAKRLPFSVVAVTAGAAAGSLFAHTHNYPGRMSIHLVPFAVATAVVAATAVMFARRESVSRQTVTPTPA
jgi:hypothetical protein